MKKRMMWLALLILVPKISSAQSAFGGTWRINLKDTQYVGKQNLSLRDGVYRCDTCVPKENVKADGRDHPQNPGPDGTLYGFNKAMGAMADSKFKIQETGCKHRDQSPRGY